MDLDAKGLERASARMMKAGMMVHGSRRQLRGSAWLIDLSHTKIKTLCTVLNGKPSPIIILPSPQIPNNIETIETLHATLTDIEYSRRPKVGNPV